ncbi:MAG: hypothetical protein WBM90_07965 [Acidimicrobiia bacterium]
MQLSHIVTGLENAVDTQLRLAGAEVAIAGEQFMAALMPAIREALMNVITMAAAEVNGQLETQRLEVRISDGDPELVISDDPGRTTHPPTSAEGDDAEARITVRLPAYLKDLIGDAADDSGASVNTYVIETLRASTTRSGKRGGPTHHRTTLEL